MSDKIYENVWSPFDPDWYPDAFDKFISIADQISNQNDIIDKGYKIPDSDGSKSSLFRNEAVLNNSFNEEALRKSLKDIYLNSSHKLIASSHDNIGFFKWHGMMSDMTFIPSTQKCEFRIPWNVFIGQKERDIYKLSQYYRKWISIEDILNNWNVFKFHILLFIDQKIYSEYELYIDEQETIVRFNYNDYWVKQNFPIYIYKTPTNYQKRILISKQLCERQWNWRIPLDEIGVSNITKAMIAFNKISDPVYRKDGNRNVEVLGDNLEFVTVRDGYIDLSNISQFNKNYILSETHEWLWLSLIVPKFFHEYPILLPVDIVHRPYLPNLKSVYSSIDSDTFRMVQTSVDQDDSHNVYIDTNDTSDSYNEWIEMIRPIVLSDAFIYPSVEPYDLLFNEIRNLRDSVVLFADHLEDFRFFLKEEFDDSSFNGQLDILSDDMENVYQAFNAFYDKRLAERDFTYKDIYENEFLIAVDDIRSQGKYSEWLESPYQWKDTFWDITAKLVSIPRELVDQHYTTEIIRGMDRKSIWEDQIALQNRIRFQRPIEESDFWIFEYDNQSICWRPTELNIQRHFPDVYLLEDPNPLSNRNKIFKAFFYYSDSPNVLQESSDIEEATTSWDDNIIKYYHEPSAIYKDIFMEKFYWMGIRSIYKGMLLTNSRWEVLEYIIYNQSYQRFNELFINTMDPYFKLGLATYVKSPSFEFPFDDAIDKLQESISLNWNSFKKINNFEIYLNNQWVPSYFDYILKLMDDWKYEDRIIHRPSNTFDIQRIRPILLETQNSIFHMTSDVFTNLEWILSQLNREDYNLNIPSIVYVGEGIHKILDNIKDMLNFIDQLDLDIYSIDDIRMIIKGLEKHNALVSALTELFLKVEEDVNDNNIHKSKRALLLTLGNLVNIFKVNIYNVIDVIKKFKMSEFMSSINDLNSYITHDKYNPNDISVIGDINDFEYPWSTEVKTNRNNLFISTALLYSTYDPSKTFSNQEIDDFVNLIHRIQNDIDCLKKSIISFWSNLELDINMHIQEKIEYSETLIRQFKVDIEHYVDLRNIPVAGINEIISLLNLLDESKMSDTEKIYRDNILTHIHLTLESVSYIAGDNTEEDIEGHIDEIIHMIDQWMTFVEHEKNVFKLLIETVEYPVPLLLVMENEKRIIDPLIQYMNIVNIPYIPNHGQITYAEIFEIDQIILTNLGFRYQIGDIVFIPNIGSYRVTKISEDIYEAESISPIHYRNTMFRDPMIQSMDYGSTTNGIGVGLLIKSVSSKRIPIQNDHIIIQYLINITNTIRILRQHSMTPNPHNNIDMKNTITKVNDIKIKWDQTVIDYNEYISDPTISIMYNLMDTIIDVIPSAEEFMESRKNVDLYSFIIAYEGLIFDVYNYAELISLNDPDFFYYENKVRTTYSRLLNFFGYGTLWNDQNKLIEILNEVLESLSIYQNNIFHFFSDIDRVSDFSNQISLLLDQNTHIRNALHDMENSIHRIRVILENVEEIISFIDTDNLYRDIWYKITEARPADAGIGYKVGDIIEIIPNDDMDHDTILLQVSRVANGQAVELSPMIDYATPYMIWGVYQTIPRTGSGSGCMVEIFSKEITLSDNIIVNHTSPIRPIKQFNDNDLFMFKFENPYDLNINYDIFLGGKQISNYIHRHIGNLDILYLNANEIMDLKNTSIHIPGDHYFVYKINDIIINDPGAGYHVGQDIYLSGTQFPIKLRISELLHDPYKRIYKIDTINSKLRYDRYDPQGKNLIVADDQLNNIDDEYHVSYYDKINKDGIDKPATLSYPEDEYSFHSKRYDEMDQDNRNETFMYPDIPMDTASTNTDGDPDNHWYQGNRIDNSQHPIVSDRWNGIVNLIPVTDPFISDNKRIPPNQPVKGEYQLFGQLLFHHGKKSWMKGDLSVPTIDKIPRHIHEWNDVSVGSLVIVESDVTNYDHRMCYRVRTFTSNGFIIYNLPVMSDKSWNHITVDWMNSDWYPDSLNMIQQYPDAPWNDDSKSYQDIEEEITDGKYDHKNIPIHVNHTSYIHDITIKDISVFNWTTKEWENIEDGNRWRVDVYNNHISKGWGFTLTFLLTSDYEYDFKFYWNKTPSTQMRNATLKQSANIDISTIIIDEVTIPAKNYTVNTGKNIRIRKLFPYEQKESYTIGVDLEGNPLGYGMDFKIAPYMHYKNQLQLQDVKIFNKTANRFENIMDPSMFEVRFKDLKVNNIGCEIQTKISQSIISTAGSGFSDGPVWGWNQSHGIHIFGYVTASIGDHSFITTFKPTHCPNPPVDNLSLSFDIYQKDSQTRSHKAVILIEFKTEKVEVYQDGYIHNVTNPLAPLPDEFKVISQLDFDSPYQYDIIIDKTPRTWTFIEPEWIFIPTFHIDEFNIPSNRIYITTDKGRLPLINPSTGFPTFYANETDSGTDVTFLNIYRKYEHLKIHSVPYPMRSVYTLRRIPSHGFIDLSGKINKPLNKKYFEFWVNGKLLHDEVTIISPTKMFLHGLQSLRNLEIIEINRDSNEYFSDGFLEKTEDHLSRPNKIWDYQTYLDRVLEGKLEGDNYTLEEQESLLTPIWTQVNESHPMFKDYPPNVDQEDDIIMRIHTQDESSITGLDDTSFEFMLLDIPTLEGISMTSTIGFEQFGWVPITNDEIVEMLNKEWEDEIKNDPYFNEHVIISDDEWYGRTTRLYDEYGILVHNLNDAMYQINDDRIIRINSTRKETKIIPYNTHYDLT